MKPKDRQWVIKRLRRQAFAFACQIAPVYAILNWKWNGWYGEEVPNAKKIYAHIMKTLDGLEFEGISSYCGGIKVTIEDPEMDNLYGPNGKLELIVIPVDDTMFPSPYGDE
jgi:hypothetical protein